MSTSDCGNTNRREFVSAIGLAGFALAPLKTEKVFGSVTGFDMVVRDRRFRASWLFAEALRSQQTAMIETQPDIYASWRALAVPYDEVFAAGLTTYADYSTICSIVAPRRLQIIYEGMHDCRRSDEVSHVLRCSVERQTEIERRWQQAETDWPTALAQSMTVSSYLGGYRESRGSDLTHARLKDQPGTLVSWVARIGGRAFSDV